MSFQDVIEMRLEGNKQVTAILTAIAVILILLNVMTWMSPVTTVLQAVEGVKTYSSYSSGATHINRSSYSVIANKDIFKASRNRHINVANAVNSQSPALAVKAHNLRLLGTVLLFNAEEALISHVGQAAKYYMTGDLINGYEIIEIGRDFVLLAGAGGIMEVNLTDGNINKSNRIKYI